VHFLPEHNVTLKVTTLLVCLGVQSPTCLRFIYLFIYLFISLGGLNNLKLIFVNNMKLIFEINFCHNCVETNDGLLKVFSHWM
jgi:hypothetical protein